MAGIPANATFGTGGGTRFALGISHPAGQPSVLYAGFEWTIDGVGPAVADLEVRRRRRWQLLPHSAPGGDDIADYCGGQCFYDNVIGVDPTNSDIVYALGLFNYGTGAGGIFRSVDGGQTWKDLGFDLHPDYHAIAIDPTNTSHVLIGNDGGVWYSETMGGRLNASDGARPERLGEPQRHGRPEHRRRSSIGPACGSPSSPASPTSRRSRPGYGAGPRTTARFASRRPARAGSTSRAATAARSSSIPTDFELRLRQLLRHQPVPQRRRRRAFFFERVHHNGIDLKDRSEFYVPEIMNQATRISSSSARTGSTGPTTPRPTSGRRAVAAISRDLTSGCTGGAANGARGCYVSALGVSSGGDGVYAGTLEGWVWYSPDGVTSLDPTWTRVGKNIFPNRPVSDFAVDRSNDRIAYAAFNGFNAATPAGRATSSRRPTAASTGRTSARTSRTRRSTRSMLDASYPDTIYAGTDVGPFVTYNGGKELAAARHRLPDRRDLAAQPRPVQPQPGGRHARPRGVADA